MSAGSGYMMRIQGRALYALTVSVIQRSLGCARLLLRLKRKVPLLPQEAPSKLRWSSKKGSDRLGQCTRIFGRISHL